MSLTPQDKVNVYLRLIDYKRSVGITQWTVLSIFVTASEAVFVLGLRQSNPTSNWLLPVFAVMIYWLGFFLYRRYRGFNRVVSSYILMFEQQIDIGFQKHLEEHFRGRKGLSTDRILLLAGIIYSLLALVPLLASSEGVT